MSSSDPLQILPRDCWGKLQESFLNAWPTHIAGYYVLEVQKQFIDRGLDYGFQVFCPYGKVENGMVGINEKDGYYEVIIQSGNDDTCELEKALSNTKVIDWRRNVTVPYAPQHVIRSLYRVAPTVHVQMDRINHSSSFIFKKNRNPYTDVLLPNNIHIGKLRQEHVDTVNEVWPHKYPTSAWYFAKLIQAHFGYGLFEDSKLASWVLVNEGGSLCHVYTLEGYRRKRYAETLLKLVCNDMLVQGKDTFAFCVHGNTEGCRLYRKLRFEQFDDVAWCYIVPIKQDK